MSQDEDDSLVTIEDNEIVIRLPVDVLGFVNVIPRHLFDDHGRPLYRIVDSAKFAESFVRQLNKDLNDSGDTLITNAFDAAFSAAIEDSTGDDDGVVELDYGDPYVAPLTDGPAG